MIIVEGRFELPGLSDVWIYPDDRTESGFYAIPAHPRVAVDSQGNPEISLVLYGRGKASNFEATGGIFTLTVCLGLSSEQEKTVISLLARRLSSPRLDLSCSALTGSKARWSCNSTEI